jgi:hypothetical protein
MPIKPPNQQASRLLANHAGEQPDSTAAPAHWVCASAPSPPANTLPKLRRARALPPRCVLLSEMTAAPARMLGVYSIASKGPVSPEQLTHRRATPRRFWRGSRHIKIGALHTATAVMGGCFAQSRPLRASKAPSNRCSQFDEQRVVAAEHIVDLRHDDGICAMLTQKAREAMNLIRRAVQRQHPG